MTREEAIRPRRNSHKVGPIPQIVLWSVAVLLWLPGWAQAQNGDSKAVINPRKSIVGEFYIEPPEPPAPETVESLEQYVQHLFSKVYITPDQLYDLPIEGTEGFFHVQIKPQKAIPLLSGNVAVTTGKLEGLAVGLEDGRIFVFSGFPCRTMLMPDSKPPKAIAWAPESPLLAALDSTGSHVYLYNLNVCDRPEEILGARDRGIEMLSMSEEGAWLTFVDKYRSLWAGPVGELLEPVYRYEDEPIGLSFTPYQGLLVAVDRAGKVVLWALKDKEMVRTFTIPGGPFAKAVLEGHILFMTDEKGKETSWKILVRGPAKQKPEEHLVVRDGKLYFKTGLTRWLKKTRMIRPMIFLSQSPSKGVLRVRDLDREYRYYDWNTGESLGQETVEAEDWTLVPEVKNGYYRIRGRLFRMADPVYQDEHQRLNCRYVQDKGFFLWWEEMGEPMMANPYPMHLPVRRNLRANATITWQDLHQGELP